MVLFYFYRGSALMILVCIYGIAGLILSMMGVDLNALKKTLSRHIRSFITEISPTVST